MAPFRRGMLVPRPSIILGRLERRCLGFSLCDDAQGSIFELLRARRGLIDWVTTPSMRKISRSFLIVKTIDPSIREQPILVDAELSVSIAGPIVRALRILRPRDQGANALARAQYSPVSPRARNFIRWPRSADQVT